MADEVLEKRIDELKKRLWQLQDRLEGSQPSAEEANTLRLIQQLNEKLQAVEAIAQSQTFNSEHRVSEYEQIIYGYRDGGRSLRFGSDGKPINTPSREIIVVQSPQVDTVLRHAIEHARAVMSSMQTVEEKVHFLSKYVQSLMPGTDEAIIDRITGKRGSTGVEVSLGQFIKGQMGVCRHRSLLFKVLADATGIPTAIVRGNYYGVHESGGHAWNEVVLENGQRVLVDVMHDFIGNSTNEKVRNYTDVNDNYLYRDGNRLAKPKKPLWERVRNVAARAVDSAASTAEKAAEAAGRVVEGAADAGRSAVEKARAAASSVKPNQPETPHPSEQQAHEGGRQSPRDVRVRVGSRADAIMVQTEFARHGIQSERWKPTAESTEYSVILPGDKVHIGDDGKAYVHIGQNREQAIQMQNGLGPHATTRTKFMGNPDYYLPLSGEAIHHSQKQRPQSSQSRPSAAPPRAVWVEVGSLEEASRISQKLRDSGIIKARWRQEGGAYHVVVPGDKAHIDPHEDRVRVKIGDRTITFGGRASHPVESQPQQRQHQPTDAQRRQQQEWQQKSQRDYEARKAVEAAQKKPKTGNPATPTEAQAGGRSQPRPSSQTTSRESSTSPKNSPPPPNPQATGQAAPQDHTTTETSPAESHPHSGAGAHEHIGGRLGAAAMAATMGDAIAKGDMKQAGEVAATGVALEGGMRAGAFVFGSKFVPVAGQVLGAGFAAADAYQSAQAASEAAKKGDRHGAAKQGVRAAVSGTETTLYGVAAGAFALAPVTGGSSLAVAVPAGLAALAVTTGKTIADTKAVQIVVSESQREVKEARDEHRGREDEAKGYDANKPDGFRPDYSKFVNDGVHTQDQQEKAQHDAYLQSPEYQQWLKDHPSTPAAPQPNNPNPAAPTAGAAPAQPQTPPVAKNNPPGNKDPAAKSSAPVAPAATTPWVDPVKAGYDKPAQPAAPVAPAAQPPAQATKTEPTAEEKRKAKEEKANPNAVAPVGAAPKGGAAPVAGQTPATQQSAGAGADANNKDKTGAAAAGGGVKDGKKDKPSDSAQPANPAAAGGSLAQHPANPTTGEVQGPPAPAAATPAPAVAVPQPRQVGATPSVPSRRYALIPPASPTPPAATAQSQQGAIPAQGRGRGQPLRSLAPTVPVAHPAVPPAKAPPARVAQQQAPASAPVA